MKRFNGMLIAAAVIAAAVFSAAPAAAEPATAYNPYFGDLHTHTSFSDGWQGTPGDAFRAAAEAGADYMATTDHNFMLTPEEWAQTLLFADQYTSPSFAPLAGSEYWITSGFGEVIVYNMTEFRTKANFHDPRVPLSRDEVIGAFYDWLASNNAIGYWPHPGLYGDQDDFDHWTPFRDQAMSVIEIHNYGSWLGAPARWGVHDYEPAYLTALDKGWHVMPAASSDTHSPNWIAGYPVRTVLLAQERTPEALLDALRSRRGYATLDQNLRISYSLNGQVMGSRLASPSPCSADIHIEDPDGVPSDAITLVELVSDGGKVLASLPASSTVVKWRTPVDCGNARYVYVRVTTASDVTGGEGVTAWTAPVWTGR